VRRDGLDVAGPQRLSRDVQLALDDGCMSDDLAALLEEDVDASQRMLPVVLAEGLLARAEGRPEQLPECLCLGLRELAGRDASKDRSEAQVTVKAIRMPI
jgi:hypothetical protein